MVDPPRGRTDQHLHATAKSNVDALGPPKENSRTRKTPSKSFVKPSRSTKRRGENPMKTKSTAARGNQPMKEERTAQPEAGSFLKDTWRSVDQNSIIANYFGPNGTGSKAIVEYLVLGMTHYRDYLRNLYTVFPLKPHELKLVSTFRVFIEESEDDPSKFMGFSMPKSLNLPLPAGVPLRPGTRYDHFAVVGPGNYSILSHYVEDDDANSNSLQRILSPVSPGQVVKKLFDPFNDGKFRYMTGTFVRLVVSDWLLNLRQNCLMACGSLQLLLTTLYRGERRFELEPWCNRYFDKTLSDLLAGQYEHRMKYLCARIQAETLDRMKELPPRPEFMDDTDRHIFGGKAYAWFFDKTCAQGRDRDPVRRLEVLNALTALKKRQPPIPQDRIEKSTKDWYKAIFSSASPSQVTNEDRTDVFSVVREIVDHLQFRTVQSVPTLSTSSRIDHSTSQAGTFGFYHDELKDEWASGVRTMNLHDVLKIRNKDVTSPEFGLEETFAVPIPSVVPRLIRTGATEAVLSGLKVEPVGLAEPFKVRMISKGPSHSYWTIGAIQKATHQALQTLECFRLTRELPTHDIIDVLNSTVPMHLNPDEDWVSGDYTAATDNCDPSLSNFIVEMISSKMGLNVAERLAYRASLTGHLTRVDGEPIIEHEAQDYGFLQIRRDKVNVKQTWGQLMGSPTSFPILCIANLALTVAALRRVEGKGSRPLTSCGIAINGDDIGFKATEKGILSWKQLTRRFGLAPSLGKNFISRDFLQINSKMFYPGKKTVDGRVPAAGDEWIQTWCQVPNASLAVLLPPRSVTFEEFCSTAPAWQETFLGDFEGADRDFLNSLYVRVWENYLNILPSGIVNWWLPREFGGFGLEPTRPVLVNPLQRRVAAFLRDSTQVAALQKFRPKWISTTSLSTAHGDAELFYKHLVERGVLDVVWLEEGEEPFSISHLEGDINLSGHSCMYMQGFDALTFEALSEAKNKGEIAEGDYNLSLLEMYREKPWLFRLSPNEHSKLVAVGGQNSRDFLRKLMRSYHVIQKSASRLMFKADGPGDGIATVSTDEVKALSRRSKGYRLSLRYDADVPRGPQIDIRSSKLRIKASYGTSTYDDYLPWLRRHVAPRVEQLFLQDSIPPSSVPELVQEYGQTLEAQLPLIDDDVYVPDQTSSLSELA